MDMISDPSTTLDPATAPGLLATVRASREAARAAEIATMVAAVQWALLHPAADLDDAALVPGTAGMDGGLAIAGEGAPLVSEFAVVELATALGRTADSAKLWLGSVLEARFRLTRTWDRMTSGEVDPWRGLRIARLTQTLDLFAAQWVDSQVAPVAHKVGVIALDRLIVEAVERFDPDQAYEDAIAAAEQRRVTVSPVIVGGCGELNAVLDEADLRDLEAAITKVAGEMHGDGRYVSPQVRRALALGEIARRELGADREGSRRDSMLYIHIDADALDQAPGEPGWARVEHGSSSYSIPVDRVREWLTVPGTRVTIRPVIDLPETASINGYEATDRLREQVILTRHRCAFPFCGRSARRADLDHIEPHARGGPASTENLA